MVTQQNEAFPRLGNRRTRTNRTFVLPQYNYKDSELHHSVGVLLHKYGALCNRFGSRPELASSNILSIGLGSEATGYSG